MSTTTNNVITDWKRLWQLVSGIHYETPESTVKEELFNVSKELQDGLLQFKTAKSSKNNLEKLLSEKKQDKLLPFTLRLQELLDLESLQCWEILCYYLANEYRGSASSLTSLISTENNMTQLLDDIWGYYTLERMIVLKIVKNLLIFYKIPSHPYHNEYKEIVDKIGLDKLSESYMKQLEHLINEQPPQKLIAREFFNYQAKLVNWSERNAREIIEVLQILLILCDHKHATVPDIQRLFNCFKQHSFGRQQPYLSSTNPLHAELFLRLAYSEVAVFLKCLDFKDSSLKSSQDIYESWDKDLTRLCHHPENGAILLSWMMFQIRCCNAGENDEKLLRCQQIGKKALDLKCFNYLHSLISSHLFKDDSLVARIVRKTIYNLLTYLCDYFDGDGSCSRHFFIYELLAELLSWPSLAKEFCNNEDVGVRSLYNTLLEIFPIDFQHISMLACSLTKAGMGNYIKNQLESLPILSDYYDESKYFLKSVGEDEYVLTQTVKPFARIDFVIPEGTSAAVLARPEGYCIHFRVPINYFNVLHHEINCLLTETQQYHGEYENIERVKRVNEGLKYLYEALKKIKTVAQISAEMVHPTEMCIDLLNKFKAVQQPPVELMANCLNVCTALLPLADAEIFIRVINLAILPVITNNSLDDYKKYAHGSCYDSNLVGTYLVGVEKKREKFDFLQAYIRFLRCYTKLQRKKYFEVEIPGLIFLLRDVFPHLHIWRFHSQQVKHKIYAEIMGFICDILDEFTTMEKDAMVPKDHLLLRDICVYSLISMENGQILLRFVALGNAYLQHCMEMESNWIVQQTQGLVLLVRLSMRILMQVLKLKSNIFKTSELSPLEALIYTQPKQKDTLRIIPVVTSYMSNIFDRWLPILSCRLLKRIALEFNMSLLACLDMEPDQIRLTFLQKLPDELESDSIKIAILELIEACIEKQPGVTEAFFKVNYQREKRIFGKEQDAQISDSIVTYMEDYLEAVSKDSNIVEQIIPSKIMNLYHMLWKQNMQLLVDSLLQKSNFWQDFCQPLFGTFKPNVKAYTQLLNILAIEIFCTNSKANNDLKQVLTKFFDLKHFEKWLDFVFDLPKNTIHKLQDLNPEEMPEWLCRLQAFKSFLLILLKKQPTFMEIPKQQFKLLAQKCLNILVERAEFVDDLRPLIILSELYIFLILCFKHAYTETSEEHKQLLKQLNKLLSKVASCYSDLHVRAREACLSIAIKLANLLSEELIEDSSLSLSFLHSVVHVICSELENLENCVKVEMQSSKKPNNEEVKRTSSNSLILCLNLLKTVAGIFHNVGFGNWDLPFISNKVFQRLLSCTGAILQLNTKQPLSVALLDVLIVFAKGNCSNEFLHCDVGDYLWLKLLPPKELLEANYGLKQPKDTEWTVQKWWPIYGRGIELVCILFQKHSYLFLKEALQFVGIHEEYLVDSLLLSKQSLEPAAMYLIKSTVSLLVNLVPFEKQWRLEHSQSLFNLMRSVQMLLGHAISMFHQPKNLKLLLAGRRSQIDILRDLENVDMVDEVITTFNELSGAYAPTANNSSSQNERFYAPEYHGSYRIHTKDSQPSNAYRGCAATGTTTNDIHLPLSMETETQTFCEEKTSTETEAPIYQGPLECLEQNLRFSTMEDPLINNRKEQETQTDLSIFDSKYKFYKDKIRQLETENKDLKCKLLKANEAMDSINKIFSEGQVRKLTLKGKIQWRWSDISNAICLQAAGARSYTHLYKKGYPLPHITTLQRWCNKIDLNEGVLHTSIKFMEEMPNLSVEDRICVLSFDEMKVMKIFEYDSKRDIVRKPANYVQVVMARGLKKSWKQPVFYNFDCKLSKWLLHEIISKLYSAGFTVVATVCDMGSSNRKLLNELGATSDESYWHRENIGKCFRFLLSLSTTITEQPWFNNPANEEEKVFTLYDAPHLLKLIRNHFLDTGLVINNTVLSQRTIFDVLKYTSKSDASITFKLSDEHLTVRGPRRQNVKLAAQLFSHTTANAIARCHSLGINVYEPTESSKFFQLVNDWFDVLNSKLNTFSYPGKEPYGLAYEKQQDTLVRMTNIMSKSVIPGKDSPEIFQEGIVTTNTALDMLHKYVSKFNMSYLVTSRLNQDVLEHFFGAIRCKGGLNDHPSPQDFKYRMRKYILARNTEFLSGKGNTEDDNTNWLCSGSTDTRIQGICRPKSTTENEGIIEELIAPQTQDVEELNDMDCSSFNDIGILQKDALEYIAGYIIRKLNLVEYECHHDSFTWVDQVSKGYLRKPSEEFVSKITQLEKVFYAINVEEISHRRNLHKNLIEKSVAINLSENIRSFFFKCRIHFRVRSLNKKLKKEKTGRNSLGLNKMKKIKN